MNNVNSILRKLLRRCQKMQRQCSQVLSTAPPASTQLGSVKTDWQRLLCDCTAARAAEDNTPRGQGHEQRALGIGLSREQAAGPKQQQQVNARLVAGTLPASPRPSLLPSLPPFRCRHAPVILTTSLTPPLTPFTVAVDPRRGWSLSWSRAPYE